jgi:hypothetical protein
VTAPPRRDVELTGAGDVTLRGWYSVPAGAAGADGGRVPGVVLTHGFSAVKEMGLDRFAEVFVAAGFAVLAYDHRNLGASGGEPRQLVDAWGQIRDLRRALDWLQAQPEVDGDRLALWGTSFSGGEALVLGAADRRVRAVVAQVPYVGDQELVDIDGSVFAAICAAALGDEPGPAAALIGPMPVVTEDPDGAAMLPQPESWKWFHSLAEHAPRWRNEATLLLDSAPAPFEPALAAANLEHTPLLMIVATDDRVATTEAQLAAYERAAGPKRLESVVGDHFVGYHGAGFEQVSRASRDFLVEVLEPEV